MKRLINVLCVVALLSACTHHHHDEHEEHEHEDAHLQLTAYNNDFEVYTEIHPFSVGNPSPILAHFTWLNTFKPLEKGSVTISLTVGNERMTQTLSTPTEKGIYQFQLTPKQSGKGVLYFTIVTGIDTSELKIDNITVYDNEEAALHAAEEATIQSNTAIKFTKEQSWQTDFATDVPHTMPFGQVIQTVAQIMPAQGEEMAIVAKTSGILYYTATDIFAGKAVTKGSTLFAVSGNDFIDDNTTLRLNEARNNYTRAKSNYDRAKSLVDSKIVSQKDFLEITNTYENAKLIYENLSKVIGANGEKVSSPLTGYLKQINVANGAYISVGQTIATVSQNRNLVLQADIPQKYAGYLSTITTANIANPIAQKVYTLEELNGKILSYGRTVSNDNYMLPITLEINNTGSFTFGSFVDVWFKSENNQQATVIPKSAIIEEQGNYFVFVQLTPELFEKKQIQIGSSDGVNVEVLSSLSPTQRLVTRGTILVKLAKSNGTLDAHSGHVH